MAGSVFQKLRYNLQYYRHASGLTLDRNRFAGQSVLVIGPARTMQQDLDGLPPAGYDLVVKMNNGLHLPVCLDGRPSWRCDVLFHSLTDEAKPVTQEALDRADVRLLIHRTPGKSAFSKTLSAAEQFSTSDRDVRFIPPAQYRNLSSRLGGFSPTTGLICLDFMARCRLDRLAVAGFTFFATRYMSGYDDRDHSDDASRDRLRATGHHRPDAERTITDQLLSEAEGRGIQITLGAGVEQALGRQG